MVRCMYGGGEGDPRSINIQLTAQSQISLLQTVLLITRAIHVKQEKYKLFVQERKAPSIGRLLCSRKQDQRLLDGT